MMRVGAASVLFMLVASACEGGSRPPDGGVGVGDGGGAGDGRQTVVEVPATINRDLDLLFVIDDSVSMLDKQANLRANFPVFINELASLPGGLPDLHLGVITTDMGTKGSQDPTPGPSVGPVGNGGCGGTGKGGALVINGAPVAGTFLSDIKNTDGSRTKNYTGTLADAFSMMASVGAVGCGFEQPLAAMRAALDNHPANTGFLRPDAMLGIVFLTDEDDCSIKTPALMATDSTTLGPLNSFRCTRFGVTCAGGGQTPEQMNMVGLKTQCGSNPSSELLDDVGVFSDFVLGLKPDPQRIVVAGIMGPPEPLSVELRTPPGGSAPTPALAHSCTYQGATGAEVADPAARMKAFLDRFPDRSTFTTVCQHDLSDGLAQIGALVSRAIGTPCVTVALEDVDPAVAGPQLDCVVEDIIGTATITIPPCDATETPTCWKLETDPQSCASADHLKLVVVRDTAPPSDTITRMRCRVAP